MKVRNLLLIAGLAGLVIVVISNFHQLKNFTHLLASVRWYVLVAVIAMQLISYYLNARYYQAILTLFGYSLPLKRLFEGALAANFVNYIIPSAGLVGAGYFSQVLSPEVPRAQGFLVQVMRYALSALGVLVMLPLGIGLILLTRHESAAVDRLAITGALVITAIALGIVAFVNQEVFARRLAKRFEKFLAKIFKSRRIDFIDKFADDFYAGYRLMVKRKKNMLLPFGWSVVYILEEIATLYLAFLAFGHWVNPGIVILAYALANIASAAGGALFSIGVFELGLVGTLVALHEPFVLALSITLLYRIMNLIIGLPPGFIFYRKFLPR